MIENIMPGINRIEVPLPGNPLKALNCYVIQSGGKSLVIDTGFHLDECRTVLDEGLRELGVDLPSAAVFITHMHTDHAGLVDELVRRGATAYCSREDGEIINAGAAPFEAMRVFVKTGGFPAQELQNAIERHPGFKFRPRDQVDFVTVEDGDVLTCGEFSFTCIKTPGHTRGHMCLYESGKKIFVAGDHILKDITPNISLWLDKDDPLHSYLASLERVNSLEVDLVLPGHRSLFTDFRERIAKLREHHEARVGEVVAILKDKPPQNAYQVAAQMTWDLTCDSFEQFPLAQKWFAAGEAFAHLKYLEGLGIICREYQDGICFFRHCR